MCRAVVCKICGKTTWAGCGAHVEQVLGHLPHDQRCGGHTKKDGPSSPGTSTGGFWSRFKINRS